MSGLDLVDDMQITKRAAEISVDAEELLKDVLGYALNASVTEVTPGNVSTPETLCVNAETGKIFLLSKQNVSSVVLSDSSGDVDGEKYTVNGPHGSVEFLDVSGITGPVTAKYSYGAARRVVMFKSVLPEIWVRLNGINKTDMSKVVCGFVPGQAESCRDSGFHQFRGSQQVYVVRRGAGRHDQACRRRVGTVRADDPA